jgi:hypothetical protein
VSNEEGLFEGAGYGRQRLRQAEPVLRLQIIPGNVFFDRDEL